MSSKFVHKENPEVICYLNTICDFGLSCKDCFSEKLSEKLFFSWSAMDEDDSQDELINRSASHSKGKRSALWAISGSFFNMFVMHKIMRG